MCPTLSLLTSTTNFYFQWLPRRLQILSHSTQHMVTSAHSSKFKSAKHNLDLILQELKLKVSGMAVLSSMALYNYINLKHKQDKDKTITYMKNLNGISHGGMPNLQTGCNAMTGLQNRFYPLFQEQTNFHRNYSWNPATSHSLQQVGVERDPIYKTSFYVHVCQNSLGISVEPSELIGVSCKLKPCPDIHKRINDMSSNMPALRDLSFNSDLARPDVISAASVEEECSGKNLTNIN